MPLRRDAQFHTIALPPDRPAADAPWSSQGPREGSLYPPDAGVLAEIAAAWTAAPGQCWFCAWDGYGWDNIAPLTAAGQPAAAPPPDPLPAGPGDPLARVEDWVTGWAEQAAADLFATGETVITTAWGTVQA